MKYIVYLTVNKQSKVNGLNRIYIGVHQTQNPEIFDGYIGCGVYINQPSTYIYGKTPFQKAVKKYGVQAFEREVLYIYDTAEEAYKKEEELVNLDFIKLSHVYNACLGGIMNKLSKPLFQFDLEGNLVKKWDYAEEAYSFYNIPREQFNYAVYDKHPLLDFLWSREPSINVSEYTTTAWGSPEVTHLYNKDGKWLGEFISRKECGEYLGLSKETISKAVLQQSLLQKQYYVSNKLVDLFIPKPRKQHQSDLIFVYDENSQLIGQGVGKAIMPIIGLHSWKDIHDIFRYKNGWYKNYYLSKTPVEQVPEKEWKNRTSVDVYDKYGNFIETLGTLKEVKQKYNVPSAKIKNLELGDRYYEEYIFKYHRKLSK